jgi:hypothetical protein
LVGRLVDLLTVPQDRFGLTTMGRSFSNCLMRRLRSV